jgi:2-(1,2-epoxy-1,2-dihydrophenyl)acetyl-CoA isomerase
MARLVREHIADCNEDEQIGAIVLTGAGRGFCSGADLQRPRTEEGQRPAPEPEQESYVEFLQRSKPIVAALNGAAVGVGFTLPLACDIRIASENARVSMRFVRIGLTPELGSTQILPQVAAEMMLTGRIYNAQEALRLGVVNKVVPHEKLLEEAMALAEEIAFNPATHVRWAKRMLHANAVNDNIRSVLRLEDEIFGQAARSPAFAEAARAFVEKREPAFNS